MNYRFPTFTKHESGILYICKTGDILLSEQNWHQIIKAQELCYTIIWNHLMDIMMMIFSVSQSTLLTSVNDNVRFILYRSIKLSNVLRNKL